MSTHHPSTEILGKFVEASLDGSLSSVVSAHVEHCSNCQKSVRSLEQALSSQAFSSSSTVSTSEMNDAWKKISSKLTVAPGPKDRSESPSEVQIDGRQFVLPRALRKWSQSSLKWMPFGKGGKICKLGDERGKSLFLIYLTSNEEVPLHSHAGAEHSYVVSGSYTADGLEYQTGDFSVSTEEVTHAPKAGSEDGCLLLSSVENRLNFLHGWLKPFNGLLWWVLNFRVRWLQAR